MKEKLLNEYFTILSGGDYPIFIDSYLATNEMKRLKYIGQFCGCDYGIYHPLFFYSRYDHSIATALMTWHFTKDKTQTLCALFHDMGTPCFSHCIDYLMGDTENQESSEKNVFLIISNSKEIIALLEQDSVSLEDLRFPDQYSIVENEKPKLCVDRLDGVLHTVLIWLHTHGIEQIKEVYNDLTILINEEGKEEIGFQNETKSILFFEMMYNYSIELQTNRDKYVMQFIADCLKILLEHKVISTQELYCKKESDIVSLLKTHMPSWSNFEQAKHVIGSNNKPNQYFVSVQCKKRYVNPLCQVGKTNKRISEVSEKCKQLLNDYHEYKDLSYAFIPSIQSINFKTSN